MHHCTCRDCFEEVCAPRPCLCLLCAEAGCVSMHAPDYNELRPYERECQRPEAYVDAVDLGGWP